MSAYDALDRNLPSPARVDGHVGSILGIGFAAWTSGTRFRPPASLRGRAASSTRVTA